MRFTFGGKPAKIKIILPSGVFTSVNTPLMLTSYLASPEAAQYQPQQIQLRVEYAE